MRVVISPDKFKGSLTAREAAEAVAEGLRRALPDVATVVLPVADGGEGTVDAALGAGYEPRRVGVTGPTGETVEALFALRGRVAVAEMAEASGLRRLPGGVPAPLTATTRGTGELVLAVLDAAAGRLVLGIGGSATTDGGAGMAQALGARLLDRAGRELPPGGAALRDLDRLDTSGLDPRLAGLEVVVASDVDNPLTGPRGAAAVYGPQKGATPADVAVLDAGLTRWAEVLRRDLGADVADRPGAGAAGGLGAGCLALLGARLVPGIDLLLDVVGFAEAVAGADLVVTGEGSLDDQSLSGKAPMGVAAAARAAGVPVVALVGRLQVEPDRLRAAGIAEARAILEIEPDVGRAQAEARVLLSRLAEELGRRLGRGGPDVRRTAASPA